LFELVEVVEARELCLELFLHGHDFVEQIGILGLDDLLHFLPSALLKAFSAIALALALLPQLAVLPLQFLAPL
jgi:hypothetical protein